MGLTFRDTKGSTLTSAEGDANIRYLEDNISITPDVKYWWTGTGLTHTVRATKYPIKNVAYSAVEVDVTPGAAHATLNRLDRIVADVSGLVSILVGDELAVAIAKDYNEETQYSIGLIFVPANATTPGGITVTEIYKENVEWTTSENTATVRINVASTNDPATGVKSIEATSILNADYIDFTAPSAINVADIGEFLLKLKMKAAMASSDRIKLQWFNANGVASGVVNILDGAFGFDNSDTTNHQQVVISKSDFNFSATTITYLRITQKGGALGWFIDDIEYQAGVIENPIIPATSTKELFTATAAQTVFVLNTTPDNIDVIVDRIHQIETIDYTVSGDTITMTDAQDSGSKIEVRKY